MGGAAAVVRYQSLKSMQLATPSPIGMMRESESIRDSFLLPPPWALSAFERQGALSSQPHSFPSGVGHLI